MFESLQWQIGGGKIRDDVDKLHIRIYMLVKRQSERDFPRGAINQRVHVDMFGPLKTSDSGKITF